MLRDDETETETEADLIRVRAVRSTFCIYLWIACVGGALALHGNRSNDAGFEGEEFKGKILFIASCVIALIHLSGIYPVGDEQNTAVTPEATPNATRPVPQQTPRRRGWFNRAAVYVEPDPQDEIPMINL